ncbi:MAG: tRNA 2-thiouridine(34) synthase MnmA [Gammaproteobacteria bacterium]|nr:tRNA 2-thiouridine(34) synthase MnmA [Gammaproteobacteria bacterium]
MSGGVDSSVAALLLRDAGYSVSGLFMKNWDEDDGTEYCTAEADLADAQAVADQLGIELHRANFAAEYWDDVFEEFLREYRAGRTPNPDVLCNREIKFRVFREYAEILGAEYTATGHYARLQTVDGRPQLLKGIDTGKDQSYFLHAVPESGFANTLFPLGDMPKDEVRAVAAEHGLPTAAKKDSTGICFIGERRFADFLSTWVRPCPGPVVDEGGNVIGEHQGVAFHTIGQRQGLGIGGRKGAREQPWYVAAKDPDANTVTVVQGNDHPALFSHELRCSTIHWIDGVGPELPFEGGAKCRYRQPDQACRVSKAPDGWRVSFRVPQRAVTPGQSVCFYSGDRCLGGGVIEEVARAALSSNEGVSP